VNCDSRLRTESVLDRAHYAAARLRLVGLLSGWARGHTALQTEQDAQPIFDLLRHRPRYRTPRLRRRSLLMLRTASHMINEVFFTPPSGGTIWTCQGMPRGVEVSGLTRTNPALLWLNAPTETMRTGRRPACSLPGVGSRSASQMSPRSGNGFGGMASHRLRPNHHRRCPPGTPIPSGTRRHSWRPRRGIRKPLRLAPGSVGGEMLPMPPPGHRAWRNWTPPQAGSRFGDLWV